MVGLILTSCSELMIVGGLSGAAVSQSPAVRAYNGVDVLTIMQTDKDIKRHIYDKVREYNKTESK